MPIVPVELKAQSYDILIGLNIRKEIKKAVQGLEYKKHSVVIITDQNTDKIYKEFLNEVFGIVPKLVLACGEAVKSIETLEKCYEFLASNHVERRGILFAVGGGVVGDIVGFVAGTYMRGIDYYQIPTSLLAMIDSSVGGKTGINLRSGKNLVGLFYQPKGVFIDIDFLKTLPKREFASGMAELIKMALIADEKLFERLESAPAMNAESPEMVSLIEKSCGLKLGIVQEDEKEQYGKRILLNLGHTFGHAIELATAYSEYLHGEAVGIGLVMAARLSELLGYIDEACFQRIKAVIEKYGLPTRLERPISIKDLDKAIYHDKKIEVGVLRFIVLNKIGKALEVQNVKSKWLHLLWLEVGGVD